MRKLDGVEEKLQRARESVFNLDSEIAEFIKNSEYPIVPEHDKKALFQAIEYHKNRSIPRRFSVLAGEIIHHLRSCFDHIVWQFSVGPVKQIRQIEFPVFKERPIDKKARDNFDRKIEGVTDQNVRGMIERLQPYNSADPGDDPLLIIHTLDIVDKHRELVLCIPTGARWVPLEVGKVFDRYVQAIPTLDPAELAYRLKDFGPLVPYVSFKNFGRRKTEPLVPGLIELFNYTTKTMEEFASF